MKEKVMQGKPYAGNPHVRFDEGTGASVRSGRSALRYKLTTRDFIKLGGGALGGMAMPVWAGKGKEAPYAGPKVRLAAIGTGGQAGGDLRDFLRTGMAEIVCAADVYEPSLDWLKKAQPNAKFYKDYCKMLADFAGKFDAVTVIVPDPSHCVAFLEALKHKVPVFCEKPLGHTFAETVAMMRKAKEAGIITQVGMQGNSFPGTQTLREWMESGELGQAEEAHIYCNSVRYFYSEDPTFIGQAEPVPKGLDWELWQGPIGTRRPFFKGIAPGGRWRSWYPYGEGCFADWCCHLLGPLVTALDLDLPTAVTVDAPGFDPAKTPHSFPTNPHYTLEFPARGGRKAFTVHWYDVNRTAPRPAALEADQPFDPLTSGWSGAWVQCEKETLMYGSHGASGLRVVPQARMRTFKRPPQKYPRVRNHYAEFLQAVLEKRPANTPFELAGKITLMGLMGTIATRFPGKRLTFDAKQMRFTECAEANALMRPDWSPAALAEYGAFL